MIKAVAQADKKASGKPFQEDVLRFLRTRFQAMRELRRGICLLNVGRYDLACEALSHAADSGCTDRSLPSYLAGCLLGQGKAEAAAAHFAESVDEDPRDPVPQIRHALALWEAGKRGEAVAALRHAVRSNPECAELHFQLGTLLTSLAQHEEAELRFTQAITIDRNHTEALTSLAMCCALRGSTTEAITHLQRAQMRRPQDARLSLLLAQAARALQQQGHTIGVRASMPADELAADQLGVEELSGVIEAEPDFVDAFLSIPFGQVDERIFAMLLGTLQLALERQPEHAELHYHCGRVLDRLGRCEDAIDENERAVQLVPRFTRALIELGRLYQQTDRGADATARLEQAVAAGAEYADVYCLLGNLYRDQGELNRARHAYRRALSINERYEAAREALASLPG